MTEPKKLDPLISEFETQEQADSYDRWFREKVQAALDDDGPTIPHDQVMAEMKDVIARAGQAGINNSRATSGTLDPLLSDFETEEQAADYDSWYRRVVTESLADEGPTYPHQQVMDEVRAIIETARAGRTRRKA